MTISNANAAAPDELSTWLRERIAHYLDQPVDTVDPDTSLTEYGMNSIYVASVLADIEERFGVEADVTVAWNHPTVNLLAGYLEELLGSPVT